MTSSLLGLFPFLLMTPLQYFLLFHHVPLINNNDKNLQYTLNFNGKVLMSFAYMHTTRGDKINNACHFTNYASRGALTKRPTWPLIWALSRWWNTEPLWLSRTYKVLNSHHPPILIMINNQPPPLSPAAKSRNPMRVYTRSCCHWLKDNTGNHSWRAHNIRRRCNMMSMWLILLRKF